MIEKLQIYKDTYLLTSKLYAAFPQMERSQRHILGAKMLDCAIDLFKWITLANKAREKIRQEIINNQQLNKRKTNGKAKTN